MRKFLTLLSSILISTSLQAGTAINQKEQQISQAVDDGVGRAKQLLEKVVNINSGTMNFEGVKAVGKVFGDELAQIGFETRWIDGSEFNRAGHLYASHGDTGIRLLLIGHLDTVYARDSQFQTYQELPGNRVKGPGITDMKGGNVIILEVLRALKSANVLDQMSIRIVLTGDEEKRGAPHALANKVLIDAAKWADIAIGFEDGDGNPETAVISRRGAVGWELEVTGKPAHSSQVFREDIGYGAIFETARILNSFRETLESSPNLTFNPGVIVGGTDVELDHQSARGTAYGKTNVIAKSTRVAGDIRAVSPEQLSQSMQAMQDIVSENLAQTSAKLTFKDGYPPMAPRESNYQLLKLYNQISMELGYSEVRAVNPRLAGAADISFAANHVKASIDGLGLMGEGGHTDNEIADMDTLPMQTKRAALLIYRLALEHQ